jgi:hypothetical protein
MQLCGSFKDAWLPVYSVPHGIQANGALPLGMDMTLSEGSQLLNGFTTIFAL